MNLPSIQCNDKIVIAFCGPSTCGKSTVIREIVNHYNSGFISVISLDNFFYQPEQLPKTQLYGQTINNKDLKESVDWESFFHKVSEIKTPVLFIDGFITFADERSFNIVDICISFEYNTETDFEVALKRRVRRKDCFKNAEIPGDYLENPFITQLNYRCIYFHDVVWPEMIKHPEYRKPLNWEKPLLVLPAINELQKNVNESLMFLHPYIKAYL